MNTLLGYQPIICKTDHFLWQETATQLAKRTVPDSEILNNWFRKILDETDH